MDVGDKPGKYWDYNECRWVKCEPTPGAQVPQQAEPAEDRTSVEAAPEVDVRSR